MKTTEFFAQLLQLNHPYSIREIEHKTEGEEKGVHIRIDVDKDYRPGNARVHDYEERTWRHLDLFQYSCYLHCRVPKFKYEKKVETLKVPWSRPNSGFTLLFESMGIELVKLHGCVSKVSKQLGIYPQRLWTIVWHYAKEEQGSPKDMGRVKRIGFDETSKKKGHDYISCFIDLDTGELLMVVEGKGAEVVTKFVQAAKSQGFRPEEVTDISVDMSPAFGAGIKINLPGAKVTYDKFHVSQLIQKAFDSIRKGVARKLGERFNKWMFFKNGGQLSREEQLRLEEVLQANPLLDLAYEMKNNFKILWQQPTKEQASAFLSFWADLARTLKRKTMTTLANSLDKFHQGIIEYFESSITNAVLEGFNSKVQTMKRNARGYRNTETLMLMIRWHCAKN